MDVNAARNILIQATVGSMESNTGGVHIRPVLFQAQVGTQKPEAHERETRLCTGD
jgi:hypothetical protein